MIELQNKIIRVIYTIYAQKILSRLQLIKRILKFFTALTIKI